MSTAELNIPTTAWNEDDDFAPLRNAQPHIRMEVVDSWHKDWPSVRDAIEKSGNKSALMLDEQGWLSARQSVLAAFVEGQVVGHLCFRVGPKVCNQGQVVVEDGKAVIEAHMDAFAVDSVYHDAGLDRLLVDLAETRAKTLQCRSFRKQ